MTHGEAVTAVLLAIQAEGGRAWRREVGLFYDKRGNKRRIGTPGEPDVSGILLGGRYIGVEVKTGNARRSAEQTKFAKLIERMGGLYVLARFNATVDGALVVRLAIREASR